MDFNNGLYVFNGVPGLEASKGERIAKGLQNLQTKIKRLEQVRISEREAANSGSTDNEDIITLSDVRLKMLFLQLQYSRAAVRTTREKGADRTAVESDHRHEQSETDYCEIPNCCKETQTGTSLHELMPTKMSKLVSTQTPASRSIEPVKEASTLTSSNSGANSRDQLTSESIPPSSKVVPMHCHLNIDLPFILGASVFESHNLAANVQCLIAKMKTHTRALCGSRFQASRNDHQDTKRMMREISKDMTKIEIKQAQIIEALDNQNTSCLIENQVKDTSHRESEVNRKQANKLLNTDSTRTSTAVSSKENRQLKSIRTTRKTKHAVPTNKMRAITPNVARQILLRSIKEYKKHLSEEDISWDQS